MAAEGAHPLEDKIKKSESLQSPWRRAVWRAVRNPAGAIGVAAVVPAILAVLGGWRGLAALAAALLVARVVMRVARARLGGVTGDVLGLTVELSELAVLLVFAAQV